MAEEHIKPVCRCPAPIHEGSSLLCCCFMSSVILCHFFVLNINIMNTLSALPGKIIRMLIVHLYMPWQLEKKKKKWICVI